MIEACAKNVFSKAARAEVKVPEDLIDRVEQLLRQRCLDILGLARRAGQMVGGYEKVRSYLSAETAGVLIAASDGAEDGRNKIDALAPDIPLIDCFSGGDLGAAIGRDRLVHAVVAQGGFAKSLLVEANKLVGLQEEAEILRSE
jgi:ribosomal protein L7Ae-like RNA K-turn-binding protein